MTPTFVSVLSVVPRHCARLTHFLHHKVRNSNAVLKTPQLMTLTRRAAAPCSVPLALGNTPCPTPVLQQRRPPATVWGVGFSLASSLLRSALQAVPDRAQAPAHGRRRPPAPLDPPVHAVHAGAPDGWACLAGASLPPAAANAAGKSACRVAGRPACVEPACGGGMGSVGERGVDGLGGSVGRSSQGHMLSSRAGR